MASRAACRGCRNSGLPRRRTLLLLFAQPLTRIAALPTSAVTITDDDVQISLGREPIPVPQPFADMLIAHTGSRPNLRAAGGIATSPWLFPGFSAGRHVDPQLIRERFERLGIDLLGARNTTLQSLVGAAPPPVVAELLGYSSAPRRNRSTALGPVRNEGSNHHQNRAARGMDEITLRPATADDLAFLFTLHKESLGPYVDQVWGWEDDDQRAYLERNLVLSRTQVIVIDGADVGRLDVEDHGDERFLVLIEIAAENREHGIGGRLIQALLDAAFAEGKRVGLSVLQVNTRAYHLTGGLASPRCQQRRRPGGTHTDGGGAQRLRAVTGMVRYLSSGIGRRGNPNCQSALTGQTETNFYCGFTSAPATNAPAGRALRPTTALTRIANLHRRLRTACVDRRVARSSGVEKSGPDATERRAPRECP